MIIYPLQAFGIGDVIFTQTLVRKIANGRKILWGVDIHFVEGLNKAYPDIMFVDKNAMNINYDRKDDYILNGMRILPIRWANEILQVPYTQCMSSKYALYKQDWKTWTKQAMWKRDTAREDELFEKLGLVEGESYKLINRFFGSSSQHVAGIDHRGTEMCQMQGFSLFDWAKVIENATEIHSVSTSIIYLLELLSLKSKEVHLYLRLPICSHFNDVSYILERQNYFLHV